MKLFISFWLWAHRAFTDPGIHPVYLYSQNQSTIFTSWSAVRAMVWKKALCFYFFPEAGDWERNSNFMGTK